MEKFPVNFDHTQAYSHAHSHMGHTDTHIKIRRYRLICIPIPKAKNQKKWNSKTLIHDKSMN